MSCCVIIMYVILCNNYVCHFITQRDGYYKCDGTVYVATGYWLDGPLFESKQEQDIFSSPCPFRKALTPVHFLSLMGTESLLWE
jgi:hypothetical protein